MTIDIGRLAEFKPDTATPSSPPSFAFRFDVSSPDAALVPIMVDPSAWAVRGSTVTFTHVSSGTTWSYSEWIDVLDDSEVLSLASGLQDAVALGERPSTVLEPWRVFAVSGLAGYARLSASTTVDEDQETRAIAGDALARMVLDDA